MTRKLGRLVGHITKKGVRRDYGTIGINEGKRGYYTENGHGCKQGHDCSTKARGTRGRQQEQTKFQVKGQMQERIIGGDDRGKFTGRITKS